MGGAVFGIFFVFTLMFIVGKLIIKYGETEDELDNREAEKDFSSVKKPQVVKPVVHKIITAGQIYDDKAVIDNEEMIRFKIDVELIKRDITAISPNDIIIYMQSKNIPITPTNIVNTINIFQPDKESIKANYDTTFDQIVEEVEEEEFTPEIENIDKKQEVVDAYKLAILFFDGCNSDDSALLALSSTYSINIDSKVVLDRENAYNICLENYDELSKSDTNNDSDIMYCMGIYHYIKSTYEQEKTLSGSRRSNYTSDRINANISESISWLEKAANKGHSDANYRLGIIYRRGSNSNIQDVTKSARYYMEAVKAGHYQSILEIVEMYEKNRSFDKAIAVLILGIEQGYIDLKYNLAMSYSSIMNTRADYDKAVYWLEQASNDNNLKAKEELKNYQKNVLGRWTRIKF